MTVFILDFFGSQAGVELLRIVDSLFTILAAILSGAALRNASQVKKAVGGVVERTLLEVVKGLFRKARHVTPEPSSIKKDAFQSLTIDQKLDSLKTATEKLWIRQGVESKQTAERLDRVDPPTRRH